MTGKDVLTLLLCSFGYDRNIKIETTNLGYPEPCYDVYAENKDGDVYEQCDSEGLMFHIYEIIAYMTNYDRFINCPSDKTRNFELSNLKFEHKWWGVPPKHILNEVDRNNIIKEDDDRNKRINDAIEKTKPFYEWCRKNNPCNSCTEKVPLVSLPIGWHHDCEICYNGSCPKMRHFCDVEYNEELKKYQ